MKKITYSAPGKVILSGEHSVVWGKPAIVSAVNLRLYFSVWEEKKDITDENIMRIAMNVRKYLEKEKVLYDEKKFNYEMVSEIPIRRGLGSSAAFSSTVTAGLYSFYTNKELPIELVNSLAYVGEKRFHKNPSGVDISAACFGGLIFFRKEFEFLKTISSLHVKIPKKIEEHLYLVDSGKSDETTGEMVEMVGDLYSKRPKEIELILNQIEKVTKRIVVSLVKEDVDFFATHIDENEKLLEKINVVSKKTQTLIKLIRRFGIGKITGAGGKKNGSGFILFFAKDPVSFEHFCRKKQIPFFKFIQSSLGLEKEI